MAGVEAAWLRVKEHIMAKPKKKQLLFSVTDKDLVFKAKRGSGSGGQKKNKTSSAIQCFHPPSGAMGEAEDSRKQSQNRRLAFERMAKSLEFIAWARFKADAAMGNIEIEEPDERGTMIKRKLRMDEVD